MEVKYIEYTIKNDIIFKFLFSDEEILKNFLEAVLDEEITEIEVTNEFSLDKIKYEDKVGVLDVKAKVNKKEIIDLEMQRKHQNYYIQRILLYTGKIEASQLKTAEKYSEVKQVISINILDFEMFPDIQQMHTVWNLREENNKDNVLPGLEYHFFELPKFRKSNPDLALKINQWLALIDTENKEWVEVAMKNNDNVKKAINKVDDFVADDETRILIELREKWQRDYYNSIEDAKDEGRFNEKKIIAKRLLSKKYNINEIIEVTGLSEKEIKELQ